MGDGKIYLDKDQQVFLLANKYAVSKTAILGLPESGKSYTALTIAEQLLDNNIPFFAVDPTGIWWGLKIGVKKNKGYPVVVAGGLHADIPLAIVDKDGVNRENTIRNVRDILHAAMKEGISVIFDIFDPELSTKAVWRMIVKEIFHYVFYNNKTLRHIFLEEAAEFAPQKIDGGGGVAYSEVERMARMGRNRKVGVTFINQRAAELNKAVYELCNISVMHAQTGKNSVQSIEEWLKVIRQENHSDIVKDIVSLESGQAWVIGNKFPPVKVVVRERKTFHPNPDDPDDTPKNSIKANVTEFVSKMKEAVKKLAAKENVATTITLKPGDPSSQLIPVNKIEYDQFQANHSSLVKELHGTRVQLFDLQKKYTILVDSVRDIRDNEAAAFEKILSNVSSFEIKEAFMSTSADDIKPPAKEEVKSIPINDDKNIGAGPLKMLRALGTVNAPICRERLSFISGFTISSSTFDIYANKLKGAGFVAGERGNFYITTNGRNYLGDSFEKVRVDSEFLISTWHAKLSVGPGKMFIAICTYKKLSRQDLAYHSGYSITSSTFDIYKNKLLKLKLIEKNGDSFMPSPYLFSN